MSTNRYHPLPEKVGAVRFDNVWEAAYTRVKTDSPKLLEAYQDGILEETRLKCKDGRVKQLQKPADSVSELQRQLDIVMEVQSNYISERQWVLHVGTHSTLQIS